MMSSIFHGCVYVLFRPRTSFSFFLMTVLIIPGALTYGANMLMLTGLSLIISCCVYAGLYNELGPPVRVPFENATLTTHWGWAFILTLVNGIVLVLCGVLVWFLYLRYPELLLKFLGLDIGEEDDTVSVLGSGLTADSEEGTTVVENTLTTPSTLERSGHLSRSAQASRRFGSKHGASIRSPALGNSDRAVLAKSLTIDEPELENSLHFQNRPVYVPERGVSVRRIRRTIKKKPRAGMDSSGTSSSSPGIRRDSMEMSIVKSGSSPTPVALSPGAMSPTSPGSLSPTAMSPLAAEGGLLTVSVKGGLAKSAFRSQASTSIELHRYPTLDEGDEEETALRTKKGAIQETEEPDEAQEV